MAINRLEADGREHPDPQVLRRRSGDAPVPGRNGFAAPDDFAPADRRALLAAARSLAGQSPPAGDLPPARLRTITERLAAGGYDAPAVLDSVARRIADDAGLFDTE